MHALAAVRCHARAHHARELALSCQYKLLNSRKTMCRVRVKPTITHVLQGIDSVPKAFEITANKGKYRAINPAQVMMRQ